MPKFKVTVKERGVGYMEKVFEADNVEDAIDLAHADDSWSDADGWAEECRSSSESEVDSVEKVVV